ncbi:sorcin-like [Gymnodraco acuticeps]|uniref:Sorcin-like n=1 Tax=Gymnodraco acuticeps TaxID=8218 RepID=A0A6P8TLU8_GYMAC|nr:sorcin-like [Gymnodraco acuticeps]
MRNRAFSHCFFLLSVFQGYGAAPGGMAQDPIYGYFTAVAGQDGQISADELQRCLTQSGIAGSYKPFSLETCRLMITMLDVSFLRPFSHHTLSLNRKKPIMQSI